jgi:type II secretory pathway pseudopilin PulG
MLKSPASALQSLLHRRGQMSTTAIVFLVLGIVFFVMVVVIGVLVALLLPAVQQARTAARSTQSKNNLKQIGLALHNYHDVYSMFPPGGIYTKNDEPYNAWMTSILPFVEQANLYNQIDFNQPWTAPKNQPVFQSVIPAFLNPNIGPEASKVVGGFGASHYAGNSQILKKNEGTKIFNIVDGTSNTILAGEISGGFMAWGDPENRRDPANGLGPAPNQFGGPAAGRGGANMLLTDGSVRFISENVDLQTLKALASPDGKEQVGDF